MLRKRNMLDLTNPQDLSSVHLQDDLDVVIPTEAELYRRSSKQLIGINTKVLARAVALAIHSDKLPLLEFHDEGQWNTIFKGTFATGEVILARVPHKSRTQARNIKSAVAIMTFARYFLKVKCPRVFAWNDQLSNKVGAPYILMEYVAGQNMELVWRNVSDETKLILLDRLAREYVKICQRLPFTTYGALYFSDKAKPPADANTESFYGRADTYTVGPYLHPPLCLETGVEWPRATFTNMHSFWKAVYDCEYAAMRDRLGKCYWFAKVRDEIVDRSFPLGYFKSVKWGSLARAARAVASLIKKCAIPADLRDPTLLLDDIAFYNILFDLNTLEITAFVDWDDVTIGPFALCLRHPAELCSFYSPVKEYAKTGCFDILPPDDVQEYVPDHFCHVPDMCCSAEQGTLIRPPSDEWPPDEHFFYMQSIVPAFFRRRLMDYLLKYDRRFSKRAYTACRDAIRVHRLVTQGYTYWISKLPWFDEFPELFRTGKSSASTLGLEGAFYVLMRGARALVRQVSSRVGRAMTCGGSSDQDVPYKQHAA